MLNSRRHRIKIYLLYSLDIGNLLLISSGCIQNLAHCLYWSVAHIEGALFVQSSILLTANIKSKQLICIVSIDTLLIHFQKRTSIVLIFLFSIWLSTHNIFSYYVFINQISLLICFCFLLISFCTYTFIVAFLFNLKACIFHMLCTVEHALS